MARVSGAMWVFIVTGCVTGAAAWMRTRTNERSVHAAAVAGVPIRTPTRLRSRSSAGTWGRWRFGYLVIGPAGSMTWSRRDGGDSIELATLDVLDRLTPTYGALLNVPCSVVRGRSSTGPVEVCVPTTVLLVLSGESP
jgi:hypothetical protein